MRLIDADDVIETISHYLGKKLYALYPNAKMPDFDKGVIDGYARARSIVFETPTACQVQHGRWLHGREVSRDYIGDACVAIHYEKWWCSECDYPVDDRPLWNYCPNCGAKMDEEE